MLRIFRQNLYDSKHCFYLLLLLCTGIFLIMCLVHSFLSGGGILITMLLSAIATLGTLVLYALFYLFVLKSFQHDLYSGHTLVFMSPVTMRHIIGAKLLLAASWEICVNALMACALNLPPLLFHILPNEAEAFYLSPTTGSITSAMANAMIFVLCLALMKSREEDPTLFSAFVPGMVLAFIKTVVDPGARLLQLEALGPVTAFFLSTVYMLTWLLVCYKLTAHLLKKQQADIKEKKLMHY